MLGHPIAHSLSPILHRAAYAELGLDGWQYDAIDVEEHALEALVDGLDAAWVGLSLTMPLKQTIIPMLDHIEPLAEVTGAVNTVLLGRSGSVRSLVGANTDVHGIVAALREGEAVDPRSSSSDGADGGTAVVLGAGATASSALAALAELGYPRAEVYVRSLGRTGGLQRAAHRMGVSPTFRTLEHAAVAMAAADLVVSTLPPHGADAIAAELVAGGAGAAGGGVGRVSGVLLDVAYEPRTTALARAWEDLGGTSVGGERMLLHQAAEQVRLMTGRAAPVDVMSHALTAAMRV